MQTLFSPCSPGSDTPSIERVLPVGARPLPLCGTVASRRLESQAQAALPAHTLMERAGLAVARLALALAPHAQRIWIACGPGNNGGDGLLAALHLQHAGKDISVTWLGQPERLPPDARHAWTRAQAAGLALSSDWPPADQHPPDLVIDALLGLGVTRAPEGRIAEGVERINRLREAGALVLAVDLPTGLDADTGWLDQPDSAQRCVRANHTLSLLSLKPGLLTAHGRDQAGSIWFCNLGVHDQSPMADAWLPGAASGLVAPAPRRHAQHKGSFGNVAVVGGAPGMTGAALLAAQAALHQGAGRVYVQLLADHSGLQGEQAESMTVLGNQPELMFRKQIAPADIAADDFTVVCGCGGGSAVGAVLPELLSSAARLLLDADALNAIAASPDLMSQLRARATRRQHSVLTPHPLEAARLLNVSTAEVQSRRLTHAKRLAQLTGSVVVLKGSGTIVASAQPDPQCAWINPSGNARLGTAGTGDVLAGWIAALWAQGLDARSAAIAGVFQHGLAADLWPPDQPLTAGRLGAGIYAQPLNSCPG